MVETGTEQAGDAAQQTASQETGTETKTVVQSSQDAAGEQEKAIQGLKTGISTERTKRQTAETALGQVTQQNLLLQQQIAKANAPATQVSPYQQAINDLGLQDEQYLTTGQNEQVYNLLTKRQNEYANNQKIADATQQFFATHTDFGEIVGSQGAGGFVASEYLTKAIEKDPTLTAQLQGANYAPIAYRAAMIEKMTMEQEAKGETTEAATKAAELLKQSDTTMSISAVGGVGNLDKGAAIKAMSDEEFKTHLEKVKSQAS